MNLIDCADLWITKHFGQQGGEITPWQLGEYVVAVNDYHIADRKGRQELVAEVLPSLEAEESE